MKSVRIAIVAIPGAVDIYVETDTAVIDVGEDEEEPEGELPTSDPKAEFPVAVKRIMDINRVIKFYSILEFTTWLVENKTVVHRMEVIV